jgi:hypothetical protein
MCRYGHGRRAGFLLAAGLLSAAAVAPAAPRPFSGTKAGEERQIAGVRLCWCPPGKFTMGSPPDEPERRPDEAQVEVIAPGKAREGGTKCNDTF